MIKLSCKIPKRVVLACSGGKDSMSALEFLLNGKREVTVAYFNHGTDHGAEAEMFLEKVCAEKGLEFARSGCIFPPPSGVSKEAYWRNERHKFFQTFKDPVVTAHHLDDAVEWWIFTSLRGNPSLMPIKRSDNKLLKPFLLTRKSELHKHLRNFEHVQDPSNQDVNYAARNYIRHELNPMCLNVNPGLFKTVKKLYGGNKSWR